MTTAVELVLKEVKQLNQKKHEDSTTKTDHKKIERKILMKMLNESTSKKLIELKSDLKVEKQQLKASDNMNIYQQILRNFL